MEDHYIVPNPMDPKKYSLWAYDFEGFSHTPAWKLELLICHFSDTKGGLRDDELFGSDADATRTRREEWGVREKQVII